jgi:hypothetical protein
MNRYEDHRAQATRLHRITCDLRNEAVAQSGEQYLRTTDTGRKRTGSSQSVPKTRSLNIQI